MTLSRLLEEFAGNSAGEPVLMNDAALEDQKLEAFEKGYKAGWEDSARAQEESGVRLSEDFARNIRDLSFTHEEARTAILGAMAPVVRQMVETVLPSIAHDTLGLRVVEMIEAELSEHGRHPVRLEVAPQSAQALRAILPQDSDLPVEVAETETLGEGQVRLRLGQSSEREIDLGHVLDGIKSASEGFFQQVSDTLKEGGINGL